MRCSFNSLGTPDESLRKIGATLLEPYRCWVPAHGIMGHRISGPFIATFPAGWSPQKVVSLERESDPQNGLFI